MSRTMTCVSLLDIQSHLQLKEATDGRAEELDREPGEEQTTVGWTRRKDGR